MRILQERIYLSGRRVCACCKLACGNPDFAQERDYRGNGSHVVARPTVPFPNPTLPYPTYKKRGEGGEREEGGSSGWFPKPVFGVSPKTAACARTPASWTLFLCALSLLTIE